MIETYICFWNNARKYNEEMLVTESENSCSFTWPHLLCNFHFQPHHTFKLF